MTLKAWCVLVKIELSKVVLNLVCVEHKMARPIITNNHWTECLLARHFITSHWSSQDIF